MLSQGQGACELNDPGWRLEILIHGGAREAWKKPGGWEKGYGSGWSTVDLGQFKLKYDISTTGLNCEWDLTMTAHATLEAYDI